MVIPEILIVILLGLILGSFSTAIIYRIPRGHPWAFAFKNYAPDDITAYRSTCTHCKAKLRPVDLVPVFSWALSKGLCRHCKASIGLAYPLTELAVVGGCLLAYIAFGFTLPAFFVMALVPFLVALLVIDLNHMILPNELVLIVGALGVLYFGTEIMRPNGYLIEDFLSNNLLGAAVYAAFSWGLGLFMSKILKKEALGFGDVKFFAVAGLWLGLSQLSWFCILSGVLGVVFAFLWQTLKKEQVFPFGPALIVSFFVLLLFDGSLFL